MRLPKIAFGSGIAGSDILKLIPLLKGADAPEL